LVYVVRDEMMGSRERDDDIIMVSPWIAGTQRSLPLGVMLSSILTFPFHVLASIIRFIFHTLRIPLPRVPFSLLNFYRPLISRSPNRSDPYAISDRWVRSLEEETGAHCWSRTSPTPDVGPSTSQPQPNNLRSRSNAASQRVLPDFTLGSYDEILRLCQSEMRIGCIVLVSNEHDDVPDFKR
jgi:FAS-associated factor 2